MKKLFSVLFLAFTVALAYVGVNAAKQMNKPKPQVEVPQIDPMVKDRMVLQEDQINEFVNKIAQDKVTDLKVSLNKEDQLEFSFKLDDKIGNLINLEANPTVASALGLLNGQTITCKINVEDEMQIGVDSCKVAGFTVPSSLYESKLDQVNSILKTTLENYGIDDIMVSGETVEIRGDISQVLDEILK